MTDEASQRATDVEFRVLGPVRVVVDERPLTVASYNQRVILAMLLLEAGRVVPINRLVDAIWEDDPPSTCRNQVQLCVCQLRKRLTKIRASDMIVTHPAGYLIRDPGMSFDLHRFQNHVRLATAVADHSPAEAVEHFRAALAVWHGDAVSDVASRIVQPAAVRLNESRMAAYEACLDLELSLGHHAQVVAELTELVARNQFRERFRAQLMLALYRSSRQAEALEVFSAWREFKKEELGLDPGTELRELQSAIIAGDGLLDLPERPLPKADSGSPAVNKRVAVATAAKTDICPVPMPQQLPLAVAGFIGRRGLLDRVHNTLVPADGQEDRLVRIVMLTGRGGAGKTALAVHAAHEVRAAFPDGQLYADLRDGNGLPRDPSAVLEGWLRAFGIAESVVPDDVADRSAMYRSLLSGKRILIVLDNVPTGSSLGALLPGAPGCAVIVTGPSGMVEMVGADHVEVGPLDERDASELLAFIVGRDRVDADSDVVRGLARLCDGLPLALRIVGAKLVQRPHWTVEQMLDRLADERRRLHELDTAGVSVRATLELSYRNLTGELQRLLTRLSVLGATDMPSWAAAAVMDTDLKTAEEMLAELISAKLLETRIAQDGTVRYRMHDLVFIYAREMLGLAEPHAERQKILRRYVRCCLALAERAHELLVGGDFEVVHGSEARWNLPHSEAERVLAEPARWFRQEQENLCRTLLLAAREGMHDAAWDLALTSLTLLESDGYSKAWREVHDAVLAAVQDAGNRLGTAAMMYWLGHVTVLDNLDESVRFLRQALSTFEEIGHDRGRGLVLRDLASADRQAGRHADAHTRYQDALLLFLQVGDPAGQASVLRNLARIELERCDSAKAEDLTIASLAIASRIGARRATAQAQQQLADLNRRRGEPERAKQLLRLALADTRQSGDLMGQAYCLLGLGRILTDEGNHSSAMAELHAAAKLVEGVGSVAVRGEVLLALAEAEFAQGRPDSASAKAREALAHFDRLGSALWQRRCQELIARCSTVGLPDPDGGFQLGAGSRLPGEHADRRHERGCLEDTPHRGSTAKCQRYHSQEGHDPFHRTCP